MIQLIVLRIIGLYFNEFIEIYKCFSISSSSKHLQRIKKENKTYVLAFLREKEKLLTEILSIFIQKLKFIYSR